MKTVTILKKARALIAQPGKWTRHAYAKNKLGSEVDPLDKTACKFCGLGAVRKVTKTKSDYDNACFDAIHTLNLAVNGEFFRFNDVANDKRQVLRIFDRAIEACTTT